MVRNVMIVFAFVFCLILPFLSCHAETNPEAQSIHLTGVGNARELGGYVTEDGRTVKKGILFRTEALSAATEDDIQRLKEEYHLSVVVDLRLTSEAEEAPDPEIEGVRNLHLRIIDEAALSEKQQNLTAEDTQGLDLTTTVGKLQLAIQMGVIGDQMYIDFLSGDQGKESYRRMFDELLSLSEGEALLFHCTQGKDRTGCAAMLILSALGVGKEAILNDYILTNTFNAQRIEAERQMLMNMGVEGDELELLMTAMDQVNPQYMVNALDWMTENYGSALGYIVQELGMTEEKIQMLRDKFLE